MKRVLQHTWLVLQKDLRLESRRRARLLSLVLFGVLILLLFSLAVGPNTAALQEGAGGFLVVALLLASTLGLSESFRAENEARGLEGLVLLPTSPVGIFYGKALASSMVLLLLGPVLAPFCLLLYGLEPSPVAVVQLSGLWALAAAGLAAPGTLYAAMTSRLRSQDLLLPLLLFPLEVPVLLATVKSFGLVLHGDPMGQLAPWCLLLVAFDVIYWSLCGVLFPAILEEGN